MDGKTFTETEMMGRRGNYPLAVCVPRGKLPLFTSIRNEPETANVLTRVDLGYIGLRERSAVKELV